MSELYALEPPTSGKVIIETNYGNIDIELFTRETPKSCKNFIQLCLDKYYNGCIFFKIFKNFLIQTGDPTNTGNGGTSIYKEDFKDEFHSRLRFNHRGVVAMANKNKPNTNGSQFFITLDKCDELNKKFTIFGKVTGPTFFNAINISNLSSNEDGFPNMPLDEKPKILNTEVVINPFTELKPTKKIVEKKEKNKKNEKKIKLDINIGANKQFNIEDEKENNSEENLKNSENENENKNDEIQNKEESCSENEEESVSLSSDDERVINAKKVLSEEKVNDIDESQKINKLKNNINLLRKKIKRSNDVDDNDLDENKEKLNSMNVLEKDIYDYIKNNNSLKLSNAEREKKLLNFKDILSNSSSGWFKNKLKFQTDSQRAYGLDEINKELNK